MVDPVIAGLVFTVAATASVFAIDGLHYLRDQQVITKRLHILARSNW